MSSTTISPDRPTLRLLLIAFGLLLAAQGALAAAQSTEIAAFNTAYEGKATDLEPIRQGPVTIHLSSPAYRVTLYRNRFAFSPAGGGVLDAAIEAELDGQGQLIALVETAATRNDFNDQLELPRQTLRVSGKVRLERVESGFRFTIVEAPATIALGIRSAALTQILRACEGLAQIPFLALSCKGLDQALSTARIPVPKPGESFVLADSSLSPAEREVFERFSTP